MVNYSINSNLQSLAMGMRKHLDKNTLVKFKINSAADISGAIHHLLTPQLKLNICSEMNLNHVASTNQKFGISLCYDNDS